MKKVVLRSTVFHISWISILLQLKVFFSYSFANREFCLYQHSLELVSSQYDEIEHMWHPVLNSLLKKWMIDLIYHLFDSCVHPCILQTFLFNYSRIGTWDALSNSSGVSHWQKLMQQLWLPSAFFSFSHILN